MEKQEISKKEKARIRNRFRRWGIRAFFLLFIVIGVIGLILPLRPTESDVEKRTLTVFPTFTWESFINGDYTDQISTWYSDTFPFRDQLISADAQFERLYGLNKEEIHGDAVVNDEIPVEGEIEVTLGEDTEDESEWDHAEIQADPEKAGTIYVAEGRGFGLYGFSAQDATNYAALINEVADRLEGIATVYDILAPTSITIYLDEETQRSIGSGSEEECYEYIAGLLDPNVHYVPIVNVLKKHNGEYIYFRSDHHWTADGAYYAYSELMAAMGKEPCPKEDYEKVEYDDFVGTYYSYSNQSEVFLENPDTVVAYIPDTNEMTYLTEDGEEREGSVVADATNFSSGDKYQCFIAGDKPYVKIVNDNIDDDSSCVVIKESYGDCFVPFLVNSFHTVYSLDYRYYTDGFYNFVEETGVENVVFLNVSSAIVSSQVNKLYSFLE